MPQKRENLVVYAAPALFVVLWASGFIGAKFGLPYVEPLTFLTVRMIAVVALLALLAVVTRPTWPDMVGIRHGIVAGLLVHGVYLGGVFISIDQRRDSLADMPGLRITISTRRFRSRPSAVSFDATGKLDP